MEPQKDIPLKILYADDDADDLEFFQDALNEAKINATLTTVTDGEKLLQHLVNESPYYPDIIFLDINMPRVNGRQCLKEIRKNNAMRSIPVIMFTTSSNPTDMDETFANGANLFVSKNCFFMNQVKILEEILSLDWEDIFAHPDKKRFVFRPHTH